MRAFILPVFALAALAGCADPAKEILFDGMRFGGRLQADKDDKRSFVATVKPVSQGLDAAREAARYEGTAYCVRKYGSSDIDWTFGPEDDEAALQIADDLMTVQGRCVE